MVKTDDRICNNGYRLEKFRFRKWDTQVGLWIGLLITGMDSLTRSCCKNNWNLVNGDKTNIWVRVRDGNDNSQELPCLGWFASCSPFISLCILQKKIGGGIRRGLKWAEEQERVLNHRTWFNCMITLTSHQSIALIGWRPKISLSLTWLLTLYIFIYQSFTLNCFPILIASCYNFYGNLCPYIDTI